jgi:hypothetical protein
LKKLKVEGGTLIGGMGYDWELEVGGLEVGRGMLIGGMGCEGEAGELKVEGVESWKRDADWWDGL